MPPNREWSQNYWRTRDIRLAFKTTNTTKNHLKPKEQTTDIYIYI
jgi:hypothetical protein